MIQQAWRCFVLLAVVPATLLAEPVSRSWTDRSGKYSVDATYVISDGTLVTLRKPSGETITVPLSRLSDHDRRYIKNRGWESPTLDVGKESLLEQEGGSYKDLSDVQRACRNCRTAEQAIAICEEFLHTDNLTDAVRSEIAADLAKWQQYAEQGKTRWGREWVTAAEIEQSRRLEFELIKQAHRLLDVRSDDLAIEKFGDASNANPEGIRADFYLGLIHALITKEALKSIEHFNECIRRLEASPDMLVGSRRANLVASLNNLALVELRMRRMRRSLSCWRQALEISPQTPELVQNLGRFTHRASSGGTRVSPRTERTVGELYAQASVANSSRVFDAGVGWLFMPYIDTPDGTLQSGGDEELRAVAYSTGFAVDSRHVIVSSYATSDADAYRIVSGGRSFTGKLVSFDRASNLALLRFQGLNAASLKLAYQPPKRGEDFHLIGWVEPGFGSDAARMLEGTFLDIRKWGGGTRETVWYAHAQDLLPGGGVEGVLVTERKTTETVERSLILHDAVANTGYIGAPMLDNAGRVVAVNLGATSQQGSGGKYCLAESARQAFDFASTAIPELTIDHTDSDQRVAWEELGGPPADLSAAVFQVASMKRAPRLKWSHRIGELHRLKAMGEWSSFSDRTCFRCNGVGTTECTLRDCANGMVREARERRYGHEGKMRGTYYVRVNCPRCRGVGRLDCPDCQGGVER